jgi:hypothetical protein
MRAFFITCMLLALIAGCSRRPEPRGQTEVVENVPAEAPVEKPAATDKPQCKVGSGRGIHSSSIENPDLPQADHDVILAERSRLRVEWGSVKVKEEGHETLLVITGRLLLVGNDGKARPIDWPQPVSVLLAVEAGATPDWSLRHDWDDTVDFDDVAGFDTSWEVIRGRDGQTLRSPNKGRPAGEFRAEIGTSSIHRPVGRQKAFQIGLCLGEKRGKSLSWTNETPVLPQSVTTVEIAGPKKLGETLRLINACPSPIGWDWDPVALVRASNHLRSLGKEKAIDSLRAFLLIARDPGYHRHGPADPANIDTSIQWCLAPLIPLVFEGGSGKGMPMRYAERIHLWEGIPFHTTLIGGTSGWPPWCGPLVDWAATDGKLIEKPLRPTDRPLEAVDALFEKIAAPEDRKNDWRGLKEFLRWQAWKMIGHLVEPGSRASADFQNDRGIDDQRWAELRAKAAKLGIRWDEQRQEYVVTTKSRP